MSPVVSWRDASCGCIIPFYLKNSFLELTKNDEDATHTRLLYYDLKMMSL